MDARIEKMVGASSDAPPVMDYEGSGYRTDFWEGQSRQYEDAVERLALQTLLPKQGGRIVEIGAGFGRLADLYLGYRQIVLFDYSRTLLQEARERWGNDPRFVFVAGNVYDLPLAKEGLDALVMVRVMHHLIDVPRALNQLHRVLHRDSVAVVEYANKRNLKAYARWLLGRQTWSPIDPDPVEFVALNFDFHPAWMRQRLEQAHFRVTRQWAVSHFRVPLLKRLIPAASLAALDQALFGVGGKFPISPSVFLRLMIDAFDRTVSARTVSDRTPAGNESDASRLFVGPEFAGPEFIGPETVRAEVGVKPDDELAALFCCPRCFCEGSFSRPRPDRVVCGACGSTYGQHEGIWDFKEML